MKPDYDKIRLYDVVSIHSHTQNIVSSQEANQRMSKGKKKNKKSIIIGAVAAVVLLAAAAIGVFFIQKNRKSQMQ